MRRFVGVSLLLVLVVQTVVAAPEGRLFPETGWRVGGRLLTFWEANGGLPVFGLPIASAASVQTAEGTFVVQVFERERLELHPEQSAPYDVQLGRLGDELLRRQGRDWRTETSGESLPGMCDTFEQTARTVCGPFRTYWREHGLDLGDAGISSRESLALFGLPLTAPRTETNAGGDRVLTQWFERARFEYHPDNPAVYQVLLGRLGAEATSEPAALPQLDVKATPAAVVQGHTTTITLTFPDAVAVRGELAGVALPFVRNGTTWRSYAGVPVLAAPESLPLVVEVDLPDGRTVRSETPLVVRDARYPRENINLPPEVQERLDQNQEEIRRERAQVNAIWAQVTPERLWEGRFVMPAQGRISSRFGTLRSYNGGPFDSFHEGLDIAAATGTPIRAPARGRVVLAEPDLLVRGGAIILEHGQGVHTGFWHQSALLVQVGDMVEQGQIIGRMGAKGMVTGPHLHWDVRIGSTNVDPEEWIAQDW